MVSSRNIAGLIALAVAACSSERCPREDGALAVVRSHALLARAVARSRVTRAPIVSEVVIATPGSARAPLRLATRDDVTIEIVADDVADVAAQLADGAAIYRDVALDTDMIELAEPGRAEELRVLRTARACTAMRWSLHASPRARIALKYGRVIVSDPEGIVRFSSEPAFALDAAGARRELTLTLEGERLTATLDVRGLRYPIVVDPTWVAAGTLTEARTQHTATLLAGDKVLVAGGLEGTDGAKSTAELYDAATNSWSTTGSMAQRRRQHAAVPALGAILFAGGSATSPTSTERYAGSSFYAGSAVPQSLSWQTLVNSTSGDTVLVGQRFRSFSGGFAFEPFAYTASFSGWIAWNPPPTASGYPSYAFVMTPLQSGKILLLGDTYGTYVMDPVARTFTAGPNLTTRRTDATATLLPNGKVLVAGGFEPVFSTIVTDAELYDPSVGTVGAFSSAGALNVARRGHAAAFLPNGKVALFGGSNTSGALSAVETYDPSTGTFASIASMTTARASLTATALGSGKILIVGGSSAELYADQTAGRSCGSTAECAAGLFCVDGVCCSTACTASCSACDVSGSVGTCTAVASGAPHGARSCGGYACVAGTCATSCTVDSSCLSTHFCSAGVCAAKKSNGAACTSTNECTSGQCVDGVCCNRACGAQCEACDVTGSVGTCTTVSGPPHGSRTACSGVGLGTTCGISCNGTDSSACQYPTTSVPCSSNACAMGIETHATTCNGAGACSDVPTSCGAYACGTTACKTTCAASTDCAAGHYCRSGACTPVEGLGKACTDASTCSSGFCTDGVCCGVATCGEGKSCALPGHEGTCTKRDGVTCASAAECASNQCVDGVCCESACAGQCQACDVAGSLGRCVAVVGAPHGARTACEKDATNPCAARLCEGSAIDRCAGYVGTEVSCREASCTEAVATSAARCDGMGACPMAITSSCDGFRCDTDAKACRTTCASADDCTTGNDCFEGKCTPKRATCSPDGLSVVRTDGTTTDCAPFVCKAGSCGTTCSASGDCRPGLLCEIATGRCVEPAAPVAETEDSGGCSTSGSGRRSGGGLALLVLLITWSRRRSPGRRP